MGDWKRVTCGLAMLMAAASTVDVGVGLARSDATAPLQARIVTTGRVQFAR